MNLLWCQVCTFYCPLRKKSYNILPETTDVHIHHHIHQKDLNLCLRSHDSAPRLLMKKHKQGIQLCYGVYSETKQHFPIWVWFQWMSLSNLFLRLLNLRKFLVLYLGCGCMAFDFITQMTLSHFLPMLVNEKLKCRDHKIYFKMLRKICKKEA